jgi:hypothetical protein
MGPLEINDYIDIKWTITGVFLVFVAQWVFAANQSHQHTAMECVQEVQPVREAPRAIKAVASVPSKTRHMSAGELTAWWKAWGNCDGPNCID